MCLCAHRGSTEVNTDRGLLRQREGRERERRERSNNFLLVDVPKSQHLITDEREREREGAK